MDSEFNLIQPIIPGKHIKMEHPDSLISPPTTPSPVCHRRSTSSLTSSQRPRPYPALNREPSLRKEDPATMSNSSTYSSWSTSGRPHHPERKASNGDKLAGYAAQFMVSSIIIRRYVLIFPRVLIFQTSLVGQTWSRLPQV